MADYVLQRRFWLPRPRPEVFAFFADPRNLERVTPPTEKFHWIAPPPPTLSAGAIIDFGSRIGPITVRWRVFVREFDPPYRFFDAQLWGPFARWEHRHNFVAEVGAHGVVGTWIEDRVTYRLPFGAVGRLVHRFGAGQRIGTLFDYRESRLRDLLGEAPPGASGERRPPG
jgi:ligand-binding SRPBCC domain-containing protein